MALGTGMRGGMTTVWRPRVRIPVPDIDGTNRDAGRPVKCPDVLLEKFRAMLGGSGG